jgi:hypothetical protein
MVKCAITSPCFLEKTERHKEENRKDNSKRMQDRGADKTSLVYSLFVGGNSDKALRAFRPAAHATAPSLEPADMLRIAGSQMAWKGCAAVRTNLRAGAKANRSLKLAICLLALRL